MGAWRQRTARCRENPRVRVRPPNDTDLDAVAALLAKTPAAVRADWAQPGFELVGDAWIADDGGRVAGYAAVHPPDRLSHAADDARAQDALLVLAAERARELGFGVLRLTVAEETAFLARNPFVLEGEILAMWRPLEVPAPAPEWPPGIAVRTFEPGDAEAVHALLDEAYLAWDSRYVPLAHDDWLRWMTGDIDYDPTVWWLAERDGDLAGCALHWRTGWLKDVAVAESERGRGLGGALVSQGLAEFARRGVERVGLKVDAANPTGAVGLYEKLGFVTERREATWALSL
jgi:GNAT superfamily N-acetyltransferase